MGAPIGNKYWQLKKNFNENPPKYNPKELWNKFVEYCEWIDNNPFKEAVLVQKGIKVKDDEGNEQTAYSTGLPKMRPYTLKGFYIFAYKMNMPYMVFALICVAAVIALSLLSVPLVFAEANKNPTENIKYE